MSASLKWLLADNIRQRCTAESASMFFLKQKYNPALHQRGGNMHTSQTIKNLSVSILDDDNFILDTTQTTLENIGVGNISTYALASEALAALDMDNPQQAVLCDLNMPGMDGVEVIRHLGQRGFAGAVIVLSGEDTRTLQTVVNMGRAYNLRLLGALSKPISQQALLNMLQQIQTGTSMHPLSHPSLSESELHSGLVDDALVPYFQPQVDARTRKVVGVEALARWQHPRYGILGPGAFIHVAEEKQLITQLTDRMITQSLRQWRQWHEAGLDLSISINLSMHSLNCLSFPDWLVAEAQAIGVPLNRLVLEITESHLAQDMKVSSDVLTRLCLKRIRLSIDDFGTAYSNMEKLQMLPYSELKIDQAFVHGAAKNKSSHAILKSSAGLGHRLGMKIVAEGVETQEDWDCAVELGCDLIQGFYAAHPMPGDQLTSWVQSWA